MLSGLWIRTLLLSLLLAGCQAGGTCSYVELQGVGEVVAIHPGKYRLRFQLNESEYRPGLRVSEQWLDGLEFIKHGSVPALVGASVGDRFATVASVLSEGSCAPLHFVVGRRIADE